MNNSDRYSQPLAWCMTVFLTGALAACGSGQDPILGTGAARVAPVPVAPTAVPATPVQPPVTPVTPAVQFLTVASTQPGSNGTAVCPTASINATFATPSGLQLDPNSVTPTTFTVTTQAPGLVPVTPATVTVDASTGHIATFKPQVALVTGVTYTASLKGGASGVKDLAAPANTMVNDYTWNFTAGPATGACVEPVPLNRAAHFGLVAGTAGMTNTGISTVITGANGTTASMGTTAPGTSSVTGFHDSAGDIYTETLSNIGSVTDKILTCTVSTTGPTNAAANPSSCTDAQNALADARTAYAALAALPPGPNPDPNAGSLANLVLAPGVYKAAGGSFLLQGSDLTLDGQGDANAVFVFQMASTLTVGGPGAASPRRIVLINGAQAKNVFWQVGSAATINAAGGGAMVGTIIAKTGVSFSTAGTTAIAPLNGRAMALDASVTLVNTVITVPTP